MILLIASVFLGPFTLIPAIIHAHRARRDSDLVRRRMTMVTLVVGYAVCGYSLLVIGMFLVPPKTITETLPLIPADYKVLDDAPIAPKSHGH